MHNRREDQTSFFTHLRQDRPLPTTRATLRPGFLMIPAAPTAVAAVAAASVVVTLYDVDQKKGGLCHFVKPRPAPGVPFTAMYGLPAVAYLIKHLQENGNTNHLRAGIYGGAAPLWASAFQRKLAENNIAVAHNFFKRKGILVYEEDTGGHRGRKIVYHTGSNEVVVMKTEQVRRMDWFAHYAAG